RSPRATLADLRLERHDLRFYTELIARDDGPPKAAVVHSRQVEQLLLLFRHDAEERDPGDLRHGLEDQDTRHHGVPGKVALEEFPVIGHVLQADHALARLQLEDPVHEEEGITVREYLEDLVDADFHATSLPATPRIRTRASARARRSSRGRLRACRAAPRVSGTRDAAAPACRRGPLRPERGRAARCRPGPSGWRRRRS